MASVLVVVRRRRRLRDKKRKEKQQKKLLKQSDQEKRGMGFDAGGEAPARQRISSYHVARSEGGVDELVVDIGAVMGLDIGGSLAKMCYFRLLPPDGQEGKEDSPLSPFISRAPRGDTEAGDENGDGPHTSSSMRRSKSLGSLNGTAANQAALRRFYTFMDNAHEREGRLGVRDEHLTCSVPELGGLLHFFRFETRHMGEAVDLVKLSSIHDNMKSIGCTGGGAYKYEDFIQEKLSVHIEQMDEMECLVRGMQFAIANIPNECYSYEQERPLASGSADTADAVSPEDSAWSRKWAAKEQQDTFRNMRMRKIARLRDKVDRTQKVHKSSEQLRCSYPALVISIGSGVSILKVEGPTKFERVSGSSIGGGTFWGLCRLLTGATDYDETLDMATMGNSDTLDMVVGDIYGQDYNKFQLSSDTLASSFGKVITREDPRANVANEDIAKSLILMVSMNIGQVAYLNAKLYDAPTLYFVGNFLRHNEISARRLSFAIDYWSGGEMQALFLEHEGYLGALGAFLKSGIEDEGGLPEGVTSGLNSWREERVGD
jgi:type II pantothenate kinase